MPSRPDHSLCARVFLRWSRPGGSWAVRPWAREQVRIHVHRSSGDEWPQHERRSSSVRGEVRSDRARRSPSGLVQGGSFQRAGQDLHLEATRAREARQQQPGAEVPADELRHRAQPQTERQASQCTGGAMVSLSRRIHEIRAGATTQSIRNTPTTIAAPLPRPPHYCRSPLHCSCSSKSCHTRQRSLHSNLVA
jgi:hypothetical protein